MKIEKQEGNYELHPAGIFKAQVYEIDDTGEGEYGPYLTIKYMTEHKNDAGDCSELWEPCSIKLTPRSKLSKRVMAIMNLPDFAGVPPSFETEDLVGQLCRIIVEHVTKPNREGEQQVYANIIAALPFEDDATESEGPTADDVAEAAKAAEVTEVAQAPAPKQVSEPPF